MDLLGLDKLKEYLLFQFPKLMVSEEPLEYIKTAGKLNWIELCNLTQMEKEALNFLNDCPQVVIDGDNIWYKKAIDTIVESLRLPFDLEVITEYTGISQKYLKDRFKNKFIWENKIFDLEILKALISKVQFAEDAFGFENEFKIAPSEMEALRSKMNGLTSLENLKSECFKNSFSGFFVEKNETAVILPKNYLKILLELKYIELDTIYAQESWLTEIKQRAVDDLNSYGFARNQSYLKEVLAHFQIEIVEKSNLYHTLFYVGVQLVCDYASTLHKIDPSILLNASSLQQDFIVKYQSLKKDSVLKQYDSDVERLSFLSIFYLSEICKIKDINAQIDFFKGVLSQYVTPLVEILSDKQEDIETIRNSISDNNFAHLMKLLQPYSLKTKLDMKLYLKCYQFLQFQLSPNQITLFHLNLIWHFYSKNQYLYIHATDIPQIMKYVSDENLLQEYQSLINTGQLIDTQKLKDIKFIVS
eukprot:NODE_62_length_26495_cov_0.832853.p6 type:complete len:473 gc:universal NODE_62_length_26495_cov_0.832853:21547-22965(+)